MADQVRKSRQELAANLLASFATGMTVITFSNPLDTLKCRWQVVGTSAGTLGSFGGQILRDEGVWRGLWRPGLGPNMFAMGCAIGIRNGFYPTIRDSLGWAQGAIFPSDSNGGAGKRTKVGPTGMFLAGLFAGSFGYFWASPFVLVKTRMQVEAGRLGPDGRYATGVRIGEVPSYRNGLDAFRTIAAKGASNGRGAVGSIRALWRGAAVISGRGASLSASQLMAYDFVKTSLKGNDVIGDGPALHVFASSVAAACCTTCSMPADVVLTVYQSAHSLGGERLEKYGRRGPLACAVTMLRESGPSVFMRGWVPAFVRLAPTCVLSFALYEQLRRLVGIGFLD